MKTCWSLLAALCAVAAALAPAPAALAQIIATEDQCAEAWSLVEKTNFSAAALREFSDSYATCPQVAMSEVLLVGKGGAGALGAAGRGWGPANGPAAQIQNQPIGVLASPNDRLIPINGGYALVLMRRGGGGNESACKVFTRYLGFTPGAPSDGPVIVEGTAVYQMPVYWPTRKIVPAQSASDCKRMLEDYDYVKARTFLDHPSVSPFSRAGGPYLAIVRGDGKQIGFFDFSGLSGASAQRQLEGALNTLTRNDALQAPFYEEPSLLKRLVGWMDGSTKLAFKASVITISY